MFSDKDMNKIENLLGKQCKFVGTLSGKGLLKVDGIIDGDIIWDDNVLLESSSICIGNISCKNAVINGKVQGNILCEDALTIQGSGQIIGDITINKLAINEGGRFTGNCNMKLNESHE